MSTGTAPVRGALFECALILWLWAASVAAWSAPVSTSVSDTPFRLCWLSDLGAESAVADRASSRHRGDVVLARVPGAAYVLAVEDGTLQKKRRLAADYAMLYGLATSGDGDVVLAADDGSVALWSVTKTTAAETHTLRWRRELDERAVSVGWDGRDDVWVATRRDRLLALAATDGETRWSVDIGARADAPPIRVDDALFVATKDYTLIRLEAASGKTKWTVDLPGPAMYSPVVAGNEPRMILASTWNGHLLAVDPETGKTTWSVELGARLAGAPVATDGFAAVATEDGAIRAFDLNGETLWTHEGVSGERTDLVLDAVQGARPRLVVVSTRIAELDLTSGEVVSEYPAGAVEDMEQRFLDVMLEGGRPYSDSEKAAVLERESFPIRGRLFGRAQRVGENLVLGTEEGWIYWLDWASLRPVGRYRAGARASGEAVEWTADTLIVPAGDAVFGVDPRTGEALWRRDVESVRQLVAADTLAIVGHDQIDIMDSRSGARRWSHRGEYQAAAAVGDGWLAFGRGGALRPLDAAGSPTGAPVVALSPIDSVVALSERRWAIAAADGRVAVVSWHDSLATLWEIQLDEPLESLHRVGGTLVASLGDRLVGVSMVDGSPAWELPVGDTETPIVDRGVFVTSDERLRLYEGGSLVKEIAIEAPVVGATLADDAVVWVDVSGTVHHQPVGATASEASASVSLGTRVSDAEFHEGTILVTTTAGEIGLIELVRAVSDDLEPE